MQVQSVLANKIDAAGDMILYDNACKQVLANKYILAWILKTCLWEYRDEDIQTIVEKYIEGEASVSAEPVHMDETVEFIEGMRTESASMTEWITTLDIKFRAI